MVRGTFPFGQPVTPCAPRSTAQARVFVLGAYPSALHAKWTSPDGSQQIRALPVDNEPEPFWDGRNQVQQIDEWLRRAAIDPERHGTFAPVGTLNGSSGLALDEHYLGPLALDRAEAWITDCLDTYRASVGVQKAIDEVLVPAIGAAAGAPHLAPHPSEKAIVKEALLPERRTTLRDQLDEARAPLIITLGNAASAVMAAVLDLADPGPLTDEGYGQSLPVGDSVQWLRLAHPAAIRTITRWRTAHRAWTTSISA